MTCSRDDEVSRKHAIIRVKNDKELYFRIADLNSSNGTFLNGERIGGEVELLPDDIVELGSGGPKFMFDVQPRPANMPARTRQMGEVDAAVDPHGRRLLRRDRRNRGTCRRRRHAAAHRPSPGLRH